MNKDEEYKLLIKAAREGNAQDVAQHMSLFDDVKLNHILCEAAKHGRAECVKLLIPNGIPLHNKNLALCMAAHGGNVDCVKLLIPVSNPKDNKSIALTLAAQNEHVECVKLLIPVSDSLSISGTALLEAAGCGSLGCVKELLPHASPKKINCALQQAVLRQQTQVVDCLLPLSDLGAVRDKVNKANIQANQRDQALLFMDTRIAEYEKRILNEHVSELGETRPKKKF